MLPRHKLEDYNLPHGTIQNILHCDHIIPVSAGGSDELDNLITACMFCNSQKSGFDPRICGIDALKAYLRGLNHDKPQFYLRPNNDTWIFLEPSPKLNIEYLIQLWLRKK
ncbi:MAG: HNH endonuclease [Synergistaceae bacterium]|nr:HNH endonuclease [Synergistaceae bacterium]